MKKILLITILIQITEVLTAQRNDSLYFNITIDSCTKGETIVNSVTKEFEIVLKKSSGTYTLFKKDNIEIGIKIYVNKIMEDERNITIIKYVFMQKTEGEWVSISSSGYYPSESLGNSSTIKVGSDKPIADFFIKYSIRMQEKKTEENKESVLDLIPV